FSAALLLLSCEGNRHRLQTQALQAVSGDNQIGVVGKELPDALIVRVTTDAGQPVSGQLISFVVTSGGGSVFAGTSLADSDGFAQERWALGDTAGQNQLEARAVDSRTGTEIVFARFSATAI